MEDNQEEVEYIIEDIHEFIENNLEKEEIDNKVSLWVKEKDIIRPSTNLIIDRTLEPGEYYADYSRELGYFCKKINSVSDELFSFSESIVENLKAEIQLFWDKKDLYIEHNLIHKRGILLEGYPGTGKSSLITQLSQQVIDLGGVVFKIQNYRNLANCVEFLHLGFRKIQPETPIITIIEDIDQYEEVESELLDFLDGKTSLNHHIVIVTSNNTEDIPDTFLRPSRLDLRIEITLPSRQTRKEYFQFKNVEESLIESLVESTEGCSLADLKEIYICVFLLDYSIDEAVKKVVSPIERKNYLFGSEKSDQIGL